MNYTHVLFFLLGFAATTCSLWIYTKYKNSPKRKRIIENIGPDIPKVFLSCRIYSYTVNSDGVILTLWVDDEFFKIKTSHEVMKMFPVQTDVVLQLLKLEEVKR